MRPVPAGELDVEDMVQQHSSPAKPAAGVRIRPDDRKASRSVLRRGATAGAATDLARTSWTSFVQP